MNTETKFISKRTFAKSARILLAVALAGACTGKVLAQGDIPSGTVSGSGSDPYAYLLTFSDAAGATGPIGSIWYSWVPGHFYLPGDPTSASAPTGWTATIVANSIQFTATSSIYDIAAGDSLSGFSYDASFSPATLASAANSGTAVAYMAGIESDSGETFTVNAVPEPSALALLGGGSLGLLTMGWRRFVRREQ